MADGLNGEIIRQPPVRVYSDRYCRFRTSKVYSRPHYLHSPVLIKIPATQPPQLLNSQDTSKSCPKARHQTSTRTIGGPGMQAVFLDSGLKSCGTGVFLPLVAGTGPKPAKKPVFSPVLLPSRVVQALNLNVHKLGLEIMPRDCENDSKKEGLDRAINRKKKGSEARRSKSCVISQNRSYSPDIFLPKEWTY